MATTYATSDIQGTEKGSGAAAQALRDAIAAGTETGVQLVAYLDGELVIDLWGGLADVDTGRSVEPDTLFNVYSVGKPVAATALHLQVERGLLSYDIRVAAIWPEFGANGKDGTTVAHVLTHRSGVPHMPAGIVPENVGDWDLVCAGLAASQPMFRAGEKTAYQAMTFGWIVGELVRRTDPQKRSFSRFVADEIAAPLRAPDLWFGAPRAVHCRIASHINANAGDPPPPPNAWREAGLPAALALVPEIFERADMREASIPAVGMLANARSMARFWAMLAHGGTLDGARLLAESTIHAASLPRPISDEPDPVMYNVPLALSEGGFWRGGDNPRACSLQTSPRAIWHPGAGGSIGWADLDTGLAVAFCHNRMFNARSCAQDPVAPIADAVRASLGL